MMSLKSLFVTIVRGKKERSNAFLFLFGLRAM